MKDFIFSNWATILIVALFFAYVVYLVFTRQWGRLRRDAYMFMLKAEKIYSAGQGYKKLNYVLDEVYNLIPAWLKFFVSEDELKLKLQEWYVHAKDYADNGKFDGSIK